MEIATPSIERRPMVQFIMTVSVVAKSNMAPEMRPEDVPVGDGSVKYITVLGDTVVTESGGHILG